MNGTTAVLVMVLVCVFVGLVLAVVSPLLIPDRPAGKPFPVFGPASPDGEVTQRIAAGRGRVPGYVLCAPASRPVPWFEVTS